MINVYIRSGRPVMEMSHGLLISGCPNPVNYTEILASQTSRQKRSAEDDCDMTCADSPQCLYDCQAASQAPDTNIVSDVLVLTQSWRRGLWIFLVTRSVRHL